MNQCHISVFVTETASKSSGLYDTFCMIINAGKKWEHRGSISTGYHMRGELISVLSLEGQYHIFSQVSAANERQDMIS